MFLASSSLGAQRLYALSEYDHVLPFQTEGIVYDAIGSHPDIFVCPLKNEVVIAPNTPEKIAESISRFSALPIVFGQTPLGKTYPHSARYNLRFSSFCTVAADTLIDPILLELVKKESSDICSVKQGYAGCNTIWLNGNSACSFITSDKGIEKALKQKGFSGVSINPKPILLPGFEHGFIGGCSGIKDKDVFFTGSLDYLDIDDRKNIINIAANTGFNIIELSKGQLIDTGGLLFFSK